MNISSKLSTQHSKQWTEQKKNGFMIQSLLNDFEAICKRNMQSPLFLYLVSKKKHI